MKSMYTFHKREYQKQLKSAAEANNRARLKKVESVWLPERVF